jgi:hypothetical protein
LLDPSYRKRAKVLGASIAKMDALKTIAEIVERTISENKERAGSYAAKSCQ